MAQIVTKSLGLEENVKVLKKENKKRYKWGFISLLAGFLLAMILDAGFLAVISFLVFIGFLVSTGSNKEKINIYKKGIKGEQNTLKALSELPDNYTVFSDVNVTFEGKSSQLDHVVVGPNGVFVIETKNWNGEIVGSDTDQKIIQYKTGRKGGSYQKEHYNPVKQVNTHVYRLASFLKENKQSAWVEGTVLFINPEAVVALYSENTRVFGSGELQNGMFLEYLQEFGKKPLEENRRKEIVTLLSNL